MIQHISEVMPSALSLISKSRVPVTEADDLEIGIDYHGRAYDVLTDHQIAPYIKYDGSLDWESLEAWAKTHGGVIVDCYKDEDEEHLRELQEQGLNGYDKIESEAIND